MRFAHSEIDVDRVDLHNGCERGRSRHTDERAQIDLMVGDIAVERCEHPGEAKIDVRGLDIGLIELNSRLGLLHDEDLILRLLRLNCLLLFQLLVAGQIHLALCERGLVVLQLRFGLIELRLIDVAFDTKELRSLRDRGAILIID